MADGKVIIDTSLDSSGIESGLGKLGGIASSGCKVAVGAIGAVISAMGVAATASIKVGMDFESGMSQVAATMGITVEEIANGSEAFEMLKQAAKDAGATTQFSATQSAEALNYLALAGYSAEKSVEALPTVLNLAAAGGLELGYASDLVTDSMSALGLQTEQLEGFVDQLAKTAQKSNTSVGQLGEAILTVGGTAKVLSGGTTELNTALGILADNGVKGAEGGTALRNIILALTPTTDKAIAAFEKLNVETYDANGNLRPLNETFAEMDSKLSTLSQEEKTRVLNDIFNKVDLKSVNALLANSGERFDELSGYIADCEGAASDMAETMNDNLKGKITILGSSLEGLGIEIYESLEVSLKDAAESAIESVGRLSEAFKNNGFEGLIEEASIILAEFLVKIAETAPQVVNSAIQIIQSFVSSIQSNLPTIIQSAVQICESIIAGIIQMLPQILQMGISVVIELARGLAQSLPNLIPMAVDCILTLVDTIVDNLDLIIDVGIELIIALADGLIESLPNIIDKVPIIIEKLLTAITNNFPKLVESGVTLIIKLAEGLVNAIPQLISKIPQIITSLLNAIGSYFKSFYEQGSLMIQRIADGLFSMVGSLLSAGGSIISSLISSVTSAVSGFFNIGKNIVEGIWNGITSMGSWITSKVSGFFSGIVNSAKKVLGIHSPSRVFRDQVGKYMAEGVGVGFEDETSNVEQAMSDNLSDITAKMQATVGYETAKTSSAISAKVNGSSPITKNDEPRSGTPDKTIIEVPIYLDGEPVARVTAPYSDKIGGQRLNLAERGLILD